MWDRKLISNVKNVDFKKSHLIKLKNENGIVSSRKFSLPFTLMTSKNCSNCCCTYKVGSLDSF